MFNKKNSPPASLKPLSSLSSLSSLSLKKLLYWTFEILHSRFNIPVILLSRPSSSAQRRQAARRRFYEEDSRSFGQFVVKKHPFLSVFSAYSVVLKKIRIHSFNSWFKKFTTRFAQDTKLTKFLKEIFFVFLEPLCLIKNPVILLSRPSTSGETPLLRKRFALIRSIRGSQSATRFSTEE